MATVAGDFNEITFNHPTIGTGVLYPKSGEDSTLDTGGLRTSDEANGVDGRGNAIYQMNRVRWSFETTIANDSNDARELQKVAQLAASPVEADFTMTNINGTVYGAKGKPVGDVQANGNTGTMTLKLSGGGEMRII